MERLAAIRQGEESLRLPLAVRHGQRSNSGSSADGRQHLWLTI
jgi:hypothetical protein